MSKSTAKTTVEKMSELDKQIAELKAKRARVARADYERVGKRLRDAGATDADVDAMVKLYAAGRMSESLAKLVAMLDTDAPKKNATKAAPTPESVPAEAKQATPKPVASAPATAPRPLTPTEKAAASSEANANRMLERVLKR